MAFLRECFGGSASDSSTSKKQPSLGNSSAIDDLCLRFSLSQLRKSTDGFDKSRIIGRERRGENRYRASISINGELKDLVLKRIPPPLIPEYKENIIYRCLVQHPNIVSVVGFCDHVNEFIAAYEYPPYGSLDDHLLDRDCNLPRLSWKNWLKISIGVACGLHYLHSGTKRTIIHLEVAPSNILLYNNWVPKLNFTHFSVKGPKFSKTEPKPELERPRGTIGYIAPELFRNAREVTLHKCDVYSFGLVLWSLIYGKYVLRIIRDERDEHVERLINDIDIDENGGVYSFPLKLVKAIRSNLANTGDPGEGIIAEKLVEGEIGRECLKLYREITESCLSVDPNERPDMGDVEVQLEHALQLQEEEADPNLHAFFN